MNQNVFNCESCPLARMKRSKASTFYKCSLTDEGQTFYDDEEPALKPAPAKCPLRKEPVIITLI